MTQAAVAMDLKVFELTPPPAPPQQGVDWSGFYFRSNPGDGSSVSWMNPGTSTALTSPAPTSAGTPAAPVNESFGYNFQQGSLVFGLEGSFAAANFDGRFTSPNFAAAAVLAPNMNWIGSVTGRMAYSFGQWLPYVKGGFASANVGSPLQDGQLGGFTQSGTQQNGWTAGVGLEYQLSSKWSLGLEYLYTDLGSGPQSSLGSGGSPEVYTTAVKSQSLLGRLNYKAGW